MSETPTTPPEAAEAPDAYKVLSAVTQAPIDPDAAYDRVCFLSTSGVDDDDEVLLPGGCDLSRAAKNFPILVCHDWARPVSYYPLPVGQVLWTKQVKQGLLGALKFTDRTEMGRDVKALVEDNILRTVSVGFRTLEASPMTKAEAETRPDWQAAYDRTKGKITVVRRWKMLELSVVPIPCNEDALIQTLGAKGLTRPKWIAPPAAPPTTEPEAAADAAAPAPTPEPPAVPDNLIDPADLAPLAARAAEPAPAAKAAPAGVTAEMLADPAFDLEAYVNARVIELVAAEVEAEREAEDRKALYGDPDAPNPPPRLLDAKAAKPAAEPEADEPDGDEPEAAPPLRRGDHVKVKSPRFKGHGVIKSVHTDGLVPDVDDDVLGTKDAPAVRVQLHKPMGDGHVPTEFHRGVKMAHCEACEPLKAPKKRKGIDPTQLPPLAGKSDEQIAAEQLRGLSGQVAAEFTRLQEKALGAV